MKRADQQPIPDRSFGIAAIIFSVLLFLLVLFVSARQGAPPSAKLIIAISACTFMSWGIKQVEAALRRAKCDRERHHHDT
jgi:ABC-type Fe3+-siderophore transport system permease subunit